MTDCQNLAGTFGTFMNRFGRFLALSCGLLAIHGCGGGGIIGQQLPRVRVFNGVDNEGTISVTFKDPYGNDLATSALAANGGVASQDAIIADSDATATVKAGSTPLFTSAPTLYRVNSTYSLYAGGAPGKYVAVAVNDVPDQGATAGAANMRGINIGAYAPSVDVYIAPYGQSATSGSAMFTTLAYGHVTASTNTTATVDGNGYAPQAVATGGGYYNVYVTGHKSNTILASTLALLYDTVYYTVVAYDAGNGTAVKVLSDRH